MGYRNYVASLPKEVHKEAKDLTSKELCEKYTPNDKEEEDGYIYFDDHRSLPRFKELHCFGKYCEFGIQDNLTRFYSKRDDLYEDCEFHVLDKDGFIKIIEWYHQKNAEYFTDMVAKVENVSAMRSHFAGKLSEWKNGYNIKPYNLEPEKSEMISSWKYEYAIFELVRIYREFDWENNVMVWYGY